MKGNKKKTLVIIGVIISAAIVMALIIITATQIKKGGSGEHYNFDCLTTPTKKPLNDCKEN